MYLLRRGRWLYVLDMEENKSMNLSRVIQKHAGRAKQIFLQNFGKADKTKDVIFEEYLDEFNRCLLSVRRLDKEIKNFLSCSKAMKEASKQLTDSFIKNYNIQYLDFNGLSNHLQCLETSWDVFIREIIDQITVPISTYLNRCSKLNVKIAKRNRKLVDYDGCRRNLQSVRNKDEVIISKAKEQFEEAGRRYEMINDELLRELPELLEKGVWFLTTNMESFFQEQIKFNKEYANALTNVIDVFKQFEYQPLNSKYRPFNGIGEGSMDFTEDLCTLSSPKNSTSLFKTDLNRRVSTPIEANFKQKSKFGMVERKYFSRSKSTGCIKSIGDVTSITSIAGTESDFDKYKENSANCTVTTVDGYDIPVDANIENLPSGVLYKVKTLYGYVAEDLDELSFERGEIIRVVRYDETYECAEGWLCGIKESSGEKGLFPANFTEPM
ncbi:amphiphysin-like [Centruroides sculpturatus]|uniref:amphiphysin-like n=1 Tax=Centruroides sculpturatus TaxID=218467 RepID=UPI000C6E06B2|nr:amphiphysin-like [Centruroides sculpturatus]